MSSTSTVVSTLRLEFSITYFGQPPFSTQILVVGGGPSGTYAAAALAREGFLVTLLEKDIFPRYHIGETFLASLKTFLKFIDVLDKVNDFGFAVKVGAAVKLNQHKREGYTDFTMGGTAPERASWSVTRADFDDLLFKHAAECGATTIDGVQITAIKFSPDDPKKPVAAEWKSVQGSGEIKFDWLVDASGKNGIMSTRYLKNRKFTQALKNIAIWGYWEGHGVYMPGTSRENAPWFEALTDETGWAWFIPLHNGTVSVGVVLSETASKTKKAHSLDIEAHYRTELKLAPGLMKLIGDGRLVSEIKSAGDYSYSSSNNQYSGPNYRIVGDAGADIQLDPLFSSGVHLAFSGALSAALTISASIRGHCTEEEAMAFHNQKIGVSYTRFTVVVLGVYKQIHAQESSVLSDIDEDNFDRAFDFIRPVIQGDSDTHSKMEEIQKTINFLAETPGIVGTDPEAAEKLRQRLPSEMADNGPFLEKRVITQLSGDDQEAKDLLERMNSKKAITGMYNWADNFAGDNLPGFSVVLEKGSLGLQRE
ncbi:putative halogenase [Mycena olivaceomarginata]|nr:putative halogenase [Mycena olivaceomarginata]